MFTDIVFPENNESEFIEVANRLGYKRLIFAYHYSKLNKTSFESSKIQIEKAIIAKEKEIKKLDSKNNIILVKETDSLRKNVEKNRGLVFFGFENTSKDFIHQRNSGLDHIISRYIKENEHSILFDFNNLNEKKIGRIKQNIKLARKFKFKTIIASLATQPLQMSAPLDLISLSKVMGMQAKEAKESLDY